MTKVQLGLATVMASVACGAFAASASATVASDMEADLHAAGIPNVVVDIAVPSPATTALDDDTDWSSVTIDSLTPFMSSDPFQPKAVATITIDQPPGTPLPGVIEPPGDRTYTTTLPERPALEVAIWEALKHALAGGADLAGTKLVLNEGGENVSTELVSAPVPGAYSPSQSVPSVMSRDAVQQAVSDGLPVWAKAADVTVEDDRVGERIVQARLNLPPLAFAAIDVSDLLRALTSMQLRLKDQGGRIGRVLARVTDPTSGDALYTAAADALFGATSMSWYSPHVRGTARGLVGPEPRSVGPPVQLPG
jgi:hypothetical protein